MNGPSFLITVDGQKRDPTQKYFDRVPDNCLEQADPFCRILIISDPDAFQVIA